MSGKIFAGGISSGCDFARGIGYAQQQDIHLATSMVREALTFSALLRQSQEFSYAQRVEYADEIIDLLILGAFAEAIVGEVGEGECPALNDVHATEL